MRRALSQKILRSFALHFALSAATAALLLLIGGCLARFTSDIAVGVASLWLPVVALGVGSAAALPLAVVQSLSVLAVTSYARSQGLTAYWRLMNNRSRGRARDCVIRAHIVAAQVSMLGFGLAASLWLAAPMLERIQDAAFRRTMLVVFFAVTFGCLSLLALALDRPLRAVVRRVDRRLMLPWPALTSLRYAIVAAPAVLAIGFLLTSYGELLGVAQLPLALLGFLLLEGFVFFLSRPLFRRLPERGKRVAQLTVAACVIAAPIVLDSHRGLAQALSSEPVSGEILLRLRALTDFDGDGVSGTYGGGDCAPFDGRRAPGLGDQPSNGIDENCDGADAKAQAVRAGPRFSNAYAKRHRRPYNVVWIIADALRPDHMSLFGYKRKTTPYLQKLAKHFTIFEHAYVQATTTHLSIPSMLVGRDALSMQWEYRSDHKRVEPVARETTLAERLKELGYRTGAVVSGHIMRLSAILQGFDETFQVWSTQGAAHSNFGAQQFLASAIPKAKKQTPFFLLLYYEDAHKPYTRRNLGEPSFGKSPSDRYDSEIAFVDRYIGMLLESLRYEKSIWKNTIVIITADHGEEFREHGRTGHGAGCFSEVMNVPLLLKLPKVKAGRSPARVALTDVVPTLLEMIGATQSSGDLTGQSLLIPLLGDDKRQRERPIFCVATKQGSTKRSYFQQVVRSGEHLLVHDRSQQRYRLFDVHSDPDEQTDISRKPAQQATLTRLREQLDAYREGNLWQLRLP